MKGNVLIADGEEFWRNMAREALADEGYRVVSLESYGQLREALSECPDVALIGFPIIGQPEEQTAKDVRSLCPEAVVLVISTSRPATQSVYRRLLRFGIADVAERPRSAREVIQLVDGELKHRRDKLASLSSFARFRLQGAR